MTNKRVISTERAPKAIGPYSQAVAVPAGELLFCSGQIPLDPATGQIVAGSIDEQTTRVLDNIAAVLEAAGCGYGDIVKTTIFLADLSDFARVNELYAARFAPEASLPARSTVQVARLPRDSRVEIEVIAAKR
jgi:2-iminobutanoate/2-iminopropanoate deaminase